jgi:putative membrane protein
MMGWGYGMGLSGWVMMGGIWLALILAAVVAVIWIFPREGRGHAGPVTEHGGTHRPGTPDPLSVLADRLARGEIDVDTYRALRAELTGADRATR